MHALVLLLLYLIKSVRHSIYQKPFIVTVFFSVRVSITPAPIDHLLYCMTRKMCAMK